MVQLDQPSTGWGGPIDRHHAWSLVCAVPAWCWTLAIAVSALLVVGRQDEPGVWLTPVAVVVAVVAAVIDWRTHRVPNAVTLTGFAAIGAIAAPFILLDQLELSGLLLGSVVMAAPLLASHLLTRGRTPGLGDVKLAAVLGLAVGPFGFTAAYVALVGSLLLGASIGIWYRSRYGTRGFPFAPAISMASIAALIGATLLAPGAVS